VDDSAGIDEVAAAAGQDPYRRALLADARPLIRGLYRRK
jgi:hypothetical protein